MQYVHPLPVIKLFSLNTKLTWTEHHISQGFWIDRKLMSLDQIYLYLSVCWHRTQTILLFCLRDPCHPQGALGETGRLWEKGWWYPSSASCLSAGAPCKHHPILASLHWQTQCQPLTAAAKPTCFPLFSKQDWTALRRDPSTRQVALLFRELSQTTGSIFQASKFEQFLPLSFLDTLSTTGSSCFLQLLTLRYLSTLFYPFNYPVNTYLPTWQLFVLLSHCSSNCYTSQGSTKVEYTYMTKN